MFKKSFGCGSVILIFIITMGVIAVASYFVYQDYISPYLNNAEIKELYQIYNKLSEDVDEASLVTNPPQESDFDYAKQNMLNGGINIFDEEGKIDAEKIDESAFNLTGNLTLTDTQLASLINEALKDEQILQKFEINTEDVGGLSTQLLEVNIDKTDEDNINLSFIVKLDMKSIKTKLGFFGFFIPDLVYVSSESSLELSNGEYQVVSGNIKVNNLDEETNERMLEILVDALKEENEDLTVEDIKEGAANLILEGIKEAGEVFNTNIAFTQNTVTFEKIS